MNNEAFLILLKGISGGTGTLSYRLGKKFLEQNNDVFILHEIQNDKNNYELLKDSGIKTIMSRSTDWMTILSDLSSNYTYIRILVYTYEYIPIALKSLNKRIGFSADIYLYVVSTRCLVKGLTTPNTFIKKIGDISNTINRAFIRKMLNNKQVLFMDYITEQITARNININLEKFNDILYPLPYTTDVQPRINIPNKNLIITMARISFPFKSYILGLIDAFSLLSEKYNSELWIIGEGESYSLLKNKVNRLPIELNKKIKLIGNVDYRHVFEYLKEAKVFVGMGTAILDASILGVPSIGVQEFNEKCEGRELFIDDPFSLGYGINETNLKSIYCLIKQVFDATPAEYVKLCEKSHEVVVNNYSIDRFFQKLILHRNRKYNYRFTDFLRFRVAELPSVMYRSVNG